MQLVRWTVSSPCRMIGRRDTSWPVRWTSVGHNVFLVIWKHWSQMPVLKPSTWWQTCFSGIPRKDQLLLRYCLTYTWSISTVIIVEHTQWKPISFIKIVISFQALRYSYFHVGQALGTPQQILEQGRPQPGLVPLQAPLQSQQTLLLQQQQPLLLKPVPPSQPPPPNQHCSPSRPLQQIQPSPLSAAAQAAVYQRHTELMLEQQSKHILKQEQTEGTPQSHLPYIVDKSLQSKVRHAYSINGDGYNCVYEHMIMQNIPLIYSWCWLFF